MIYFILFCIYILSVLSWRKYIDLAYSKNGIWSYLEEYEYDMLIGFTPIVNSLFSIYGFIFYYPIKKRK